MIQEDVCILYMRGAGTFPTLELGLGFFSSKIIFILLFTNAGKKSKNFEPADFLKIHKHVWIFIRIFVCLS